MSKLDTEVWKMFNDMYDNSEDLILFALDYYKKHQNPLLYEMNADVAIHSRLLLSANSLIKDDFTLTDSARLDIETLLDKENGKYPFTDKNAQILSKWVKRKHMTYNDIFPLLMDDKKTYKIINMIHKFMEWSIFENQ